ncbi:MAG TPA: EAL domain-containing protein, partial [Burkholderiales bacterium]|nr:EAL domain-containing protein [Burkholderiales bacterium]
MWFFESDEHDSLQRIIEAENLTALFQPIVDLESAEIFGYEGLVRGPSDSPLHSPFCLFKAASECDLLCEVEGLCHKILVDEFMRLKLPGKLFLNVSPEALVRHMNERFRYALFHGGIDSGNIVIELIESGPSTHFDPGRIRESLAKFCSDGYSVAIDDLGEGFSNFRLWSELRPTFVKIDRHFIQNIDQDPLKVKFVRSIQEIASSVGTLVIAEGIETHSELMVVKSMGVRYGQGYHIARPHPSPGTMVTMDVARTIKSFSAESVPWGRDSITARGIVHADIPVNARQTNAEILGLFEQ